MNLIKEISDRDIRVATNNDKYLSDYRLRRAARSIVFDMNWEIAVLYVGVKDFHKLPGGGVEAGETLPTALKREVLEEVGCEIDIKEEIGMTIEFRNEFKLLQLSYVYISEVVGAKNTPTFTTKEIDNDFKLLWMKPKDAVEKLSCEKSEDYEGKFIQQRELAILREYFG